MCYRTV
ncbi:unnamed protein product [Cyprideis torosa]|nr:unnamed protein product [Cyprideis torosa]CAG0904636.1 unnamed protein product [Cyprideis torosa]